MLNIDIERLIDIVTEENDAYTQYKTRSLELRRKTDLQGIEALKKSVSYCYEAHSQAQACTSAVLEVFKLDTEQRNRLYIAARAVRRWRISTEWARLIPETMKNQIAAFVFGPPSLGMFRELPYWWNDNQIGPFEIV